jgi:hypothetical protein
LRTKRAKRWLITHSQRVRPLRPVYLGDALFSCQPLAEAVLATGADFLFVCKKDGHKTLYEFVDGATLDEHTVTRFLRTQGASHLELLSFKDSKTIS